MKKRNVFSLVLMLILLSACSPQISPTPTPAPTNTPVPTPTHTLIPPTATLEPTPTPEPSPTPDPLLFQDEFDGVVDSSWQWIRENNRYWSLTNNPGWLEIMARSGGVGNGSISNLLLRPAPEGNFVLETRLKFKPTGNFQIAGLLIYESVDEFVQFGRAFCNAAQCAGDGYYVDLISGGGFTAENFATRAGENDTVELRLTREGNLYTGYVRENEGEWQIIGTHLSGMNPVFVGLVAGQAVGSTPKPAQFDYFIINALP